VVLGGFLPGCKALTCAWYFLSRESLKCLSLSEPGPLLLDVLCERGNGHSWPPPTMWVSGIGWGVAFFASFGTVHCDMANFKTSSAFENLLLVDEGLGPML
jgi:hypothetical protein